MKWSSGYMARRYKLLILLTAFSLAIFGLIAGNERSSIPFSAFFLLIICFIVFVVFWNSFDSERNYSKKLQSNPGVLSNEHQNQELINDDIGSQPAIPNPLDSEIDIPLM